MDPNQLFVRRTQLGGRAWLWVFATFVSVTLARFGWYFAHQTPYVLGIEVATILVLLAVALLPPCLALIRQARRRYRTRGLSSHKPPGVAYAFLAIGLLFGVVFPSLLGLELLLFRSTGAMPAGSLLWLSLGYLFKMGLALVVARTGWLLLRDEPRSSKEASRPAA